MNMEKADQEITHSKLNMASYGFGSLTREFLNMAFVAYSFFYYESEIGLNVWIVTLGYVLFAIYNMFNDPFIGYLLNRPFKFTKKWGRRFPWILIGGFPLGFSYVMVFLPPTTDAVGGAWILFGWLLFTTCLFDTFHSLFFVNFMTLFPEKYRTTKERRTASGIYIPIGVIGVALGAILPPLFITYGDLTTYAVQGFYMLIIALITLSLGIPGFREDQVCIDNYLKSCAEAPEREPFFKSLKIALKQKSFIAYMVIYTLYQSQIVTMQNSLPYTVRYVLGRPANATTLIFAGMLIGVIVATPLWLKYAKKVNDNKKVMLYSSIFLGIFTLPLLFLTNYIAIIIAMLIWGTALGGFWFMIFPVMADVVDDSVIITGKREEGVYVGFSQFFGRLGIVAQAITFGTVHALTGFVEGAATQPPLAVWGIQLHLGFIPMIFIFIGALVFWKYYKLSPEKIQANDEKLMALGLK